MPGDPFSVLGLPPSFEVSDADLQRAWLRACARLHPDRAGASEDAESLLAELNEARATLADPERRTAALLAIRGGAPESDPPLAQEFLMEMLEAREQMEEEIGAEGDPARDRWEEWASERRTGHITRVAALFADGSRGALAEIRKELNEWRYIERLLEQVRPGAAS